MIKEVKPNEIITYRDTQIRAVEDNEAFRCSRCCLDDFYGIFECIKSVHQLGDCRADHRIDGKNIRFELIDE